MKIKSQKICAVVLPFSIAFALLANKCDRNQPEKTSSEAAPNVPGAAPGIRLISPLPAGEWRLPLGDYANTRFSVLDQINTSNVKNLKVITTLSTGIPQGHEGQPLIVNNTMYIVTPYPNNLIALDLTKPGGTLKWIYEPHPDSRSVGIACCDVVNRDAVTPEGRSCTTRSTRTRSRLTPQRAGVWKTQVGDINVGETTTMAPLAVKNLVFVGNSGGELGVRGKLVALDLATGKEVWRAYNNGPDKDVLIGPDFKPFYAKDQGTDMGMKSWPPDQWKLAARPSGVGSPMTPN